MAGHLGGHIAAEDAHQVGRLLEQGVKLKARVPVDATRRGSRKGKEVDLHISF